VLQQPFYKIFTAISQCFTSRIHSDIEQLPNTTAISTEGCLNSEPKLKAFNRYVVVVTLFQYSKSDISAIAPYWKGIVPIM
jgi:hypothetical protein